MRMIRRSGAAARARRAISGDDVFAGFVVHRLRGIDPQPIEPVFVDPVGGVAAEELADRTRFGSVEVQPSPHSFERGEIVAGVTREHAPVRTEVVVDHVEDDARPSS